MLEKVFEKKERLEEIFKEKGVVLTYIFGSFSKEIYSDFSDIDIAILFGENVPPEKYFDLSLELSSLLTITLKDFKREIDLVILNSASITLKYQVIKYGKVIYEEDERIRVIFETEVLNYYLDTKYIRDESFKYLLKRIKEGKIGYVFRPEHSKKKD